MGQSDGWTVGRWTRLRPEGYVVAGSGFPSIRRDEAEDFGKKCSNYERDGDKDGEEEGNA